MLKKKERETLKMIQTNSGPLPLLNNWTLSKLYARLLVLGQTLKGNCVWPHGTNVIVFSFQTTRPVANNCINKCKKKRERGTKTKSL